MVFIDQGFFVFEHEPFDLPQIMWRYTTIASKGNGRKPKLAFGAGAANVDVRRFVSFIRIEVEAESANS